MRLFRISRSGRQTCLVTAQALVLILIGDRRYQILNIMVAPEYIYEQSEDNIYIDAYISRRGS